jgi:hypothetical protein
MDAVIVRNKNQRSFCHDGVTPRLRYDRIVALLAECYNRSILEFGFWILDWILDWGPDWGLDWILDWGLGIGF